MRVIVYAVAVVAAVGIMLAIVLMPAADEASEMAGQAEVSPAADATEVAGETQSLVLHVPDMHCPFACYPAVKQTLEAAPNVKAVDLAEQTEEGEIDNPQVIVSYADGFDLESAVARLAERGFKNATQVP